MILPLVLHTPPTNWNPNSGTCVPLPLFPGTRAQQPRLFRGLPPGPKDPAYFKEACASHCHGNLWASLTWGLGFLVFVKRFDDCTDRFPFNGCVEASKCLCYIVEAHCHWVQRRCALLFVFLSVS